jgi:type IV pilus biogenesis protein CpaD/CtpE
MQAGVRIRDASVLAPVTVCLASCSTGPTMITNSDPRDLRNIHPISLTKLPMQVNWQRNES